MPYLIPPVAALGAVLAQRALSSGNPPPSKGRAALAATITVASLTTVAAAVGRFRQVGTTLEPQRPERASVLVTSGANAVSRNPMYLGLAGLLAAHALWRGSWAALIPLAGFVIYIDRAQIQAEEKALLKIFGAEFDAYRTASPRWLDRRSLDSLRA